MRRASIVVVIIIGVVILILLGIPLVMFLASLSLLKLIFAEVFTLIGFLYWPFKFYTDYYKTRIKQLKYDRIRDSVDFNSGFVFDKDQKRYHRVQ